MDPAKQAAFDQYLKEQAEKKRLDFDRVITDAGFQEWEVHGIHQIESDMDAKDEQD